MPFEIRCKCGQRVQVGEQFVGKSFECPKCGTRQTVAGPPPHSQAHPSERSAPKRPLLREKLAPVADGSNQEPHSILQFILIIVIAWAVLTLLSLVVAIFISRILGVLLILAVTVAVAIPSVQALLAKRHVLHQQKEIDLFFGLAKLVSWDPTEGVLFLRNKSVSFVDDSLEDGGGIRLIYPVFGEELACRAPLEVQTLSVHDDQVMTREYLPLRVHGTIKWRIVDLRRFYLLVSREIHVAADRNKPVVQAYLANHPGLSQTPSSGQIPPTQWTGMMTAARKLEAAEHWLRFVAEEQTRSIASKLSTGLLVADQVASDLPSELRAKLKDGVTNPTATVPTSSDSYITTSDNLGAAIQRAMIPRVSEFGIDVHEVTLQEVRLPQHIHHAAVEACRAAYVPLIAQKHALGRKIELQAEADILGAETLAAREVVSNAPPIALVDFLASYLAKNSALLNASEQQTQKSLSNESQTKLS